MLSVLGVCDHQGLGRLRQDARLGLDGPHLKAEPTNLGTGETRCSAVL
jgi:hypothetical protein